MIKKFLKKFIFLFLGKVKYQTFFEKIHKFSLVGMYYGMGGDVEDSGEIVILKRMKGEFNSNYKPAIFDVGANKGQYTKSISSVFGKNVKIYSFEPGKNTFNMLLENCKDLKNIEFFNFGFGSNSTIKTLYSDFYGSGLASFYNRRLDHFGFKMEKREDVEITTIDEFCIKKGITNIDLLKIDVEGYELEVLKGAKKMIDAGRIKVIQFEFGGCNIDSRTYFQDFYYLLKDKYDIYRIVADGIVPIKNYSERYEIFITVNYLAKLKEFALISQYEKDGGIIKNATKEQVAKENYACGCFWFVK